MSDDKNKDNNKKNTEQGEIPDEGVKKIDNLEEVKKAMEEVASKKEKKASDKLSKVAKVVKDIVITGTPKGEDQLVAEQKDLKKAIKIPLIIALIVFSLGFGFFGIWASFAPLDSAAIAPGEIIVAGHNRIIQHREGGIIKDILVKEGDIVRKGEPIVLLDTEDLTTNAKIQLTQLRSSRAKELRLLAESRGLDYIEYKDRVFDMNNHDVIRLIEDENNLFEARSRAFRDKIATRQQRIVERENTLLGLKYQLVSREENLKDIKHELNRYRELVDQGLTSERELHSHKVHYNQAKVELENTKLNIKAQEDGLKTSILELSLEKNAQLENVRTQLDEITSQVVKLRDQYHNTLNTISRSVIRAPSLGRIKTLSSHTIGGVIGPGQAVAELVPVREDLIVEAKVQTKDIESLTLGLDVKIQLAAFKSKLVPRIMGKVTYISPDRIQPPPHTPMPPYYIVHIDIPDAEVAKLRYNVELKPGMPATAFIVKGTRTLIQYLLSPITESFYKALKEP